MPHKRPSSSDRPNSIFNLTPKFSFANPAPEAPKSKLYASIGVSGLRSTASSDNKSKVQTHDFNVFGVDSILGYRTDSMIFGLGVNYAYWSQQTNPQDIGDSNLQGTQFCAGLVLGYEFEFIEVFAHYNLISVFRVENKNLAGERVQYLDSESYALQVRYNYTPSTYFGLHLTRDLYNSYTAAGKKRDLLKDDELELQALGLNLGVKF